MRKRPVYTRKIKPPGRGRWNYANKAWVVEEVKKGKAVRQQLLNKYQITEEELESWEKKFAIGGLSALKINSKSRRTGKNSYA